MAKAKPKKAFKSDDKTTYTLRNGKVYRVYSFPRDIVLPGEVIRWYAAVKVSRSADNPWKELGSFDKREDAVQFIEHLEPSSHAAV